MWWGERLVEKLNLRERYKKVIVDKFGITEDKEFVDFLNRKNIDVKYVSDEKALLLSNNYNIIITSDIQIPVFVRNKSRIYTIEDNLPFQLSLGLIKKYKKNDIKKVIAYNLEVLKYPYLDESNFENIQAEANRYFLNKRNKFLENDIKEKLKNIETPNDILEIAQLYGEIVYNSYLLDTYVNNELIKELDKVTFDVILNSKVYINAFYSTISDFKTVDKVILYIKSVNPSKFALVCFDGMGVPEWYFLKQYFQSLDVNIKERYIFALIPTITKISRSSLFSGKLEECYKTDINESLEFKDNFQDLYCNSFSEGEINENSLIGVDAVKIVYNLFDDNAHSFIVPPNKINKNGYFEAIKNYLRNSTIIEEIKILLNSGYKIFLSADHGCIVAKGMGSRIDKYLIESSSKRAAVVKSSSLLEQYKDKYFVFEPPFSNSKVVMPKDRLSFHFKDKFIITHGGITLEELVVPFVEIDL